MDEVAFVVVVCGISTVVGADVVGVDVVGGVAVGAGKGIVVVADGTVVVAAGGKVVVDAEDTVVEDALWFSRGIVISNDPCFGAVSRFCRVRVPE